MSFASPPVDTTIPAASYPSSPESTRSPPWQAALPATPNYRTAFQHDPFEDLGQHSREDRTIQQALNNAQNNAFIGLNENTVSQQDAIRDTLSRFASAPTRPPPPTEPLHAPPSQATRQSLDVEAFKRLLLTGESGTASTSTGKQGTYVLNDSSSGTDATSISQQSATDSLGRATDDTPRSSHEQDRSSHNSALPGPDSLDQNAKVPPPAPAPRRGKSIKMKTTAPDVQPQISIETASAEEDKGSKKPPTPPLARRHSQQPQYAKNEEVITTPSDTSSPVEPWRSSQKAPPPPPVRRQHSVAQRRPSQDLAPTIEEPESGSNLQVHSRRSSSDRPDRPPPPPSRNSSASIKRQSLGLMNPPPLPPPRKGRGSSRSSIDSFRPSLSSVLGENTNQDNSISDHDSRRSSAKDQRNLTPSNADSILAELANLQREVDAARRGA